MKITVLEFISVHISFALSHRLLIHTPSVSRHNRFFAEEEPSSSAQSSSGASVMWFMQKFSENLPWKEINLIEKRFQVKRKEERKMKRKKSKFCSLKVLSIQCVRSKEAKNGRARNTTNQVIVKAEQKWILFHVRAYVRTRAWSRSHSHYRALVSVFAIACFSCRLQISLIFTVCRVDHSDSDGVRLIR